jgi:hypothetical protein
MYFWFQRILHSPSGCRAQLAEQIYPSLVDDAARKGQNTDIATTRNNRRSLKRLADIAFPSMTGLLH